MTETFRVIALACGNSNAIDDRLLDELTPALERIERSREEAQRGFLDTWFSRKAKERRRAMLEKS